MSSALTTNQPSPEVLLTQFLTSIINTKEIDTFQLSEKLASTPVDQQLRCLKNVHNENGRYLLHHAVYDNKLGVVECIRTHLVSGSEQFYSLVGQADMHGSLPLHYAFASVKRGVFLESVGMMIDLLLGSFDDVKRCSLVEQAVSGTPNLLFFAVTLEAPSLALKVLGYLSESDRVRMLDIRDPQSNTALHQLFTCADEFNFAERLCRLIPAQQMVELLKVENLCGDTPLHKASIQPGNPFSQLLSVLEQKEVDYFAGKLFEGIPFLHHLAGCFDQSYLVMVLERLSDEVLLESMSQINLKGVTLLHWVSSWGNAEAIAKISARLSIDQFCRFLAVKDECGMGPVHCAVENKTWNVLICLINFLPCPQLVTLLGMQDEDGNPPFRSIIEGGNVEIKTLLLRKTFEHLAAVGQVGYKDQLEVISLRERVSELEREVQIKDSQIKDQPETARLRERVSEFKREVQVKDSQLKELQAKIGELEVKVNTTEDNQADESEEEGSFDSSEEDSLTFTDYTNSALPGELYQATLELSQPAIGGVCELVVIVEHAELSAAYLVGTAHSVLPLQRLQQLRNGTAHSQVRQQLDGDARDCHYRVLFRPTPNQEEFVDAFHAPFFGYRCGVQENVGVSRLYNGIDLRRCRNDMALLRIDPTKAEDLYSVLNCRPGRNDRLVKMYSQDKLEEYTRPPRDGQDIRIYVKEHYGSLTFSRNADGQLAPDDLYQLRFVLDNNEQLGRGDSGSVVYQVSKRGGQPSLRPLGLFIGRSKHIVEKSAESTIYLAAFIDLAFQDIKGEYGEVNGIRLMHARPRRSRQVRSGEQNLPAQS